ncbi:GntR family transcriptional regulator [Arthrobacter sp. Br18]|uniref:GntR family transcriptional regulator n=1 Tax=Arthrobacter sp. Br18 TaxID=1312954 RepID=UPI0004B49381|nr:GntR family transcriptional regulator [Arthrobacter sp. Br18]
MRASDRAYESLRSDIISWRLEPGSVLAEVEQSARLGVSRTPLREALSRLIAEGLAAPHSGRGVVVTEISLGLVADLFAVRIPLECTAVRLAALRRAPAVFDALGERFAAAGSLIDAGDSGQDRYYALVAELDDAVDRAAGNPYLLQAQRHLRTQLVRVRRLARDNRERLRASAGEHAQIARAICAGNGDLASAAMQVHLHNSLQHLLTAGTDSYDVADQPEQPHYRKELHG